MPTGRPSAVLGVVRGRAGVTLTELVVVMAVMSILASVALPLYRVSAKRAKEYELKHALMEMRDAVDRYKWFVDNKWVPKENDSGYPESLDLLVEGVEVTNRAVAPGQTKWNPPGQLPERMRFLRKVPVDPMTGEADWGTKGNEDVAKDSMIGSGRDVYDVYSLSDGVALDGTDYEDW